MGWRNILNARDYDIFLSEDLISEYLERSIEIIAEREIFEPEAPPNWNWTRGQDYQLCPDCGKIICLRGGCNHIVCLCGAKFCFVCGNIAFDGESGHWNEYDGGPHHLQNTPVLENGPDDEESGVVVEIEEEHLGNGVANGVNGGYGLNGLNGVEDSEGEDT